jgi:hypothetical protein
LRETRPDSAAIVPGFREPVVFAFDEVIDERSAPKLADLVVVSPRHKEIKVAWKRTRFEVRPADGWRDGAVYRVVLLPNVRDLRGNRTRAPAEVVFSTGPAIPDTRIGATIIDWNAGRLATRSLLEAYPLPVTDDSVAYIATADSTGEILLRRAPPGDYLLVGLVDENANRRRDRREAFDSLTVRLDTSLAGVFWTFVHDTVGPQLRETARTDSVTVQLTFSQPLAPDLATEGAVTARLLPDSTPVTVTAVWTALVWDSVKAVEAAARDSARAAADTTPAAPDTSRQAAARDTTRRAPVPTREPAPTREPGVPGAPEVSGGPDEQAVAVDTARIAALLRERPRLSTQLIVRLGEPLAPGARYLFEARAVNLAGASASSRITLEVPDTTAQRRPR